MSGKVAVITGAAGGIGSVTAKKLLQVGMKVALLDICEDELEKTTKLLQKEGGSVHSVICDVTDKDQVFSAIKNVKNYFGNIDILVANAAVCNATDLSKLHVDKWIQVVDVNVTGVLHCVAAVLPGMIDKAEGHILFMSSVLGRQAIPSFSPYCSSKHFIQGYAAGIRQELAPLGIKVSCIQPGLVNTNIVTKTAGEEVWERWGKFGVFDNPELTMLQPEDVAKSICFCLTQKDHVGVNQITFERSSTISQSY